MVGDLAKRFPFDEPWNDLTNFIDCVSDASEDEQREYENPTIFRRPSDA